MNTISPLPLASFAGAVAPLRDLATAGAPASAWLQAGDAAASTGVELHAQPGGAPLDLDAAERDFLAALCTPSSQPPPFG